MVKDKKILICGAGSIGIFLGTILHSNNNQISLFGRRKLKEVKETVIINGKKYPVPEKIFNLPKNEYYNYIFITSKLYDIEKILKMISKKRLKTRIFIGIQNGLVDKSVYKNYLNKKRFVPICVFGGFRIEKSNIYSSPTSIGWVAPCSKEGIEISKFLSENGILCRADKKFESLRAEKMIVNCCLNALSAIEKKPFKDLFSNKFIKERIFRLFEECYNILKKDYPLGDFENMKKRLFENWHSVNHYSSTYQDAVSGRKSEINFFNGFIVRIGKKHKINAEENKKILEDFKKL